MNLKIDETNIIAIIIINGSPYLKFIHNNLDFNNLYAHFYVYICNYTHTNKCIHTQNA